MAEGKAAIVVGGVRGLGKAYCEALLREGAKVNTTVLIFNLIL